MEYAEKLNCKTVQIFTHNPRSFQFKPLDDERLKVLLKGWKNLGINPVVSHCSYLINLGSSDNRIFYGSLSSVKKELEYAQAFGCKYFVLHVGKYKDTDLETGMRQVAKGINKLKETFEKTGVMLLLETVAGQGTEIGVKFEELHELFKLFDKEIQKHVGVCVDTCHLFAAGYDIKNAGEIVKNIKDTFGIDKVKVVHVNDSKFGIGERKDRHEHVGQGKIGTAGLKSFLTHPDIRKLPMILETPIDENGDQLSDLKALNKLIEKR